MGRRPDRRRNRLMWAWALVAAAADGGGCTFLVDGAAVDRLDCASGGAWVVRCAIPDGPSGRVRLHAAFGGGAPSAEARIAAGATRSVDVPLSGPGGRAGAFVVTRASGGLLPGQALGPNQWCPVVQPEAVPGGDRIEVRLDVTLASHRQTGFAEEVLEGGVTNRVPLFDAGEPRATGRTTVVQRAVGTIPVTTGPVSLGPVDQAVRGQLSIAGTDGAWRSFGWTGSIVERPLETGDVRVLTLDFIAPEIAVATGGDPIAWLEADLGRWLARDATSLLAQAAWARSGFEPAGTALPFAPAERSRRPWRVARDERLEIRTLKVDADRLRVVIAWRAAPWDDAVTREVEATAARGL